MSECLLELFLFRLSYKSGTPAGVALSSWRTLHNGRMPLQLLCGVSRPRPGSECPSTNFERVERALDPLKKLSRSRGGGGGHSQTIVLPTRVQTPQKWTLNGVLRHIKFAPLNGVTPVKHNLNGVIMGVTYPKWRTLLWYTVQYPKWRTLLWYTVHTTIPKWRTVYMVHSTIP